MPVLRPWSWPSRARVAVALLAAAAIAGVAAQEPVQPETPLPRFRGGTNLVRVDAYVSVDGEAVTDLTADDFEVFEDDQPQQVENFEFIRARGDGAPSAIPSPTSTRDQILAAKDPDARLFVLYLDRYHVGLNGSFSSPAPVRAFLEKVVGPRDLVGVMTPDISPENMTLIRGGDDIERALEDVWHWGVRDNPGADNPFENAIQQCYPEVIAREVIERRREQLTLRSLTSTISYLDSVRDERKFVLLLSEGWQQFQRNDALAGPLDGQVPGGIDNIGVGPDGRLVAGTGRRDGNPDMDACDRERVMLAYIDHQLTVREMAQRANRANVTFYPLDPRGLTVFDRNPAATPQFNPQSDWSGLTQRHDGLKVLAEQTGGAWILNTNDTAGALTRLLEDTSSYYLLSYYSTSTRLDGRFRRITVRVKRDDVDVRARPGYLAPTEAEARAGGASLPPPPGAKPTVPPAVARAIGSLMPARGVTPLRVQATGLAGRVRAIVEFDPATMKQPAWQTGGTLQVTLESDKGVAADTWTVNVTPSQRSVVIDSPDDLDLPAGRYMVRVEGRPSRGGASVRASAAAVVRDAGNGVAESMLLLRRGPATGLAYQATADPRFRRTERIRAELAAFASDLTATGRVLTREGQPLPLQVSISERTDDDTETRLLVADVTLAPLAQGDYVLEIVAGRESVIQGFRIVP